MAHEHFDGTTLPKTGTSELQAPSLPPIIAAIKGEIGIFDSPEYRYIIEFETATGERTSTTDYSNVVLKPLENYVALVVSSIEQPTNSAIKKINIYRQSTNTSPNYYLVRKLPVGQTVFIDKITDNNLM